MDRVVSQLLTEISGMQNNDQVFVIGATNRPDLLDDSLLRPGRFDRLIYLGISANVENQLKVVKAVTRKFEHEANVDFNYLLEAINQQFGPGRFTGADIAAFCNQGMSNALQRKVTEFENHIMEYNQKILQDKKALVQKEGELGKRLLNPRKLLKTMSDEELNVKVSMEDYEAAIEAIVPSVSAEELLHYENLRKRFSKN